MLAFGVVNSLSREGGWRDVRFADDTVGMIRALAIPSLLLAPWCTAQPEKGPPPVEPVEAPVTQAAQPAPLLSGEMVAGGRLLPEGSFVVSRRCVLIEAPTGDWVAVYEPPASPSVEQPILPPMVIVPSRTLERVLQTREDDASIVELTGRVLLYRARNYLLASSFSLPAPILDEHGEPEADAIDARRDPAVQKLLDDLIQSRQQTMPSITPAAKPKEKIEIPTVGEGTTILRRRGRVFRANDGGWSLTLDGDTLPAARRFRLVPGSILRRIEATAGRLGSDFPIIITGRTLSYDGEVYLLPTFFTIEHASQVAPIQ